MKVSIVAPILSRRAGGLAFAIPPLVEKLEVRADTEVEVLGIADPAHREDATLWGSRVTSIDAAPSRIPWSSALYRALGESGADLIDVHGLWQAPGSAALAQSIRQGTPRVVTPHGMLDPWAMGKSRGKKRLALGLYERRNLRSARVVRALCAAEARAIEASVPGCRIKIVPNAVGIPPEPVRDPNKATKTLLFLGRIDAKKGVLELLNAWRMVAGEARSGGWRLAIHGWGDAAYVARVAETLQTLGLSGVEPGTATLAGPVFGPDKTKVMQAADAFVLPSYSEGLPMAVLEAWSYAMPALITAECNLPEGFTAGAALEAHTDVNRLAEDLLLLLTLDSDSRAEMGAAGRQLAISKFGLEAVTRKLAAMYVSALDSSAKD